MPSFNKTAAFNLNQNQKMKKLLIIAGLLAVSSAAFAASAKTSKPIALNKAQMSAAKVQGTFTVYSWTGVQYVVSYVSDTGPHGPSGAHYVGGPLDGVTQWF